MGDCWIALLRGINVGTAKRIAMADLRATVQSLGYQDVATLLNSGNVVFRQPQGAKAPPAPAIEQAVAKRLGVSTTVIAMPVTALDAILCTNPLAKPSRDPSRLLVAATVQVYCLGASFFSWTNGRVSGPSSVVRSAAATSIASTCRHGVSYPIPTCVCRIRPRDFDSEL